MKLVAIVMLLMSMMSDVWAADVLHKLSDLKWSHRIILATVPDDSSADMLVELFEQADSEIKERNIVWFIMGAEEVKTNYSGQVSQNFLESVRDTHFQSKGEAAVLIGKDGGVKLRQKSLNLKEQFALIDTMPMRRQEMRREY